MARRRAKTEKGAMSRRKFLETTGATGLALGTGAISGFPYVHAADPVTLRYASTAVTQDTRIAAKFEQDRGSKIQYIPLTSADVVKTAVTQPNRFDILEPEVWMVKKIVPSGNLQGMDRNRIEQMVQDEEVEGKSVRGAENFVLPARCGSL